MNTHLLETYSRPAHIMHSGKGAYLTDIKGNRYLDMVTGIGVNALGYSHPSITAILAEP